jgi:hypothetical protein
MIKNEVDITRLLGSQFPFNWLIVTRFQDCDKSFEAGNDEFWIWTQKPRQISNFGQEND